MKKPFSFKIPEYITANLDKYKYVLVICVVGLALMLWPTGTEKAVEGAQTGTSAEGLYDVGAVERQLEQTLSEIDGVGRLTIMLTVKSGYESVYVYDQTRSESGSEAQKNVSIQTEMVTVTGGGEQSPVVRKVIYPEYMGAVVICDGGDSPKIQLELSQAIKSLTGISFDNIIITKMKN